MILYDEWDYDGINEVILVEEKVKGKMCKIAVYFDRNGFGYIMDRETGELLVVEKYDPVVNWLNGVSLKTGRYDRVAKYSTARNGEDVNTTGICPAALGFKDQQPAAYSPRTGLYYVLINYVCMDYEPFEVEYTSG
jgi:glucose dehydrogenase